RRPPPPPPPPSVGRGGAKAPPAVPRRLGGGRRPAGQRVRRRIRRGCGRGVGRARLPAVLANQPKENAMTPASTPPVGPYTPAVRAGDWLIVSGQVGIKDGELVGGGIRGQLGQAVANLAAQLEANGAGLDHGVQTTGFMTSLGD